MKVMLLVMCMAAGACMLPDAGAAAEGGAAVPNPVNLVKQANSPLSSIMQIRLQDTYLPEFTGVDGSGNTLSIAVTMPLPKNRLLPLPQLSLLTIPAVVSLPGDIDGIGDLRLVDIAILHAGRRVIWGVGATAVFPTASKPQTGQGKWQVGPAAVLVFVPEKWLLGVLVQNPVSVAGDRERADVHAMILQPFVTRQLGAGWFVRSQPQLVFNWQTGKQTLPIDLGVGRVFRLGQQQVSCFVQPFYNLSHEGPAPKYGITFGITFMYPNFWKDSAW